MLPVLKTTTTAIAEMTDANELAAIYRQAEALVRLMKDDYETQAQIAKRRNHALRRIGQLRDTLPIGKPDFDKSLGLSGRDVEKAKSLASLSDLEFEHRETKTGAILFSGTPYGGRLARDNEALMAARAAKREEEREAKREEREGLYAPRPVSRIPETLEGIATPVTPGMIDITPAEDDTSVKQWLHRVGDLLDTHPFHGEFTSEQRQEYWQALDDMIGQIAKMQGELQDG